MTTTFAMGIEYVAVSCGHESHGPGDFDFAMTRTFYDETKRTGRGWYCPMGHSRVWRGKTTEQELRDAKARELSLKDQAAAAVRDAEHLRVALLRDRQRFANGVCPCCNRSFENVRRHMTSQHPDYDVTRIHAGEESFECSCGRVFDTLNGLRIHQGKSRRKGWDAPTAMRWASHLTEGVTV